MNRSVVVEGYTGSAFEISHMPFKQNTLFNTTRIAVLFTSLAAAFCLLVLAGWILNVPSATTFGVAVHSMKVNTAIGILAAAGAHILFLSGRNQKIARLLNFIVFIIGGLTLSQYIFNTNLHIDALLFKDDLAQPPVYPGRMSQAASIGLLLTGISLFLNTSRVFSRKMIADVSASLVVIFAFLVCAGKFFDAELYKPIKAFSHLSFPSSLSLLFISLGILFSKPQVGLMNWFYENSGASKVGTKQFLLILGILVVLGWLCNAGIEMKLYNPQLGITIMITLFVMSFFFIIRSGIANLSKSEAERNTLFEQNEKKSVLLKKTFERIQDPFIALDKNWCFTYVNERAGDLAGRKPESLIGKNIWEEFPALVGSETDIAFRTAMEKQCILENTEYYAPFDLWHEDIIYPSPDGLSVFIQDITEKKKSEILSAENEAKYRSLFDHSPDGILLTVPEGDVLAANAAACAIFNMTEKEICEGGRASLVDMSDPNLPILLLQRKEKGRSSGELRFKRKDGSVFPGEITSVIFKDRNGNERSSMIIRDISERKFAESKVRESENRLNEAQRIAHIGSWVLDIRQNTLDWSAEIFRIFEIDPERFDASYEAFLETIHPDDRERVHTSYNDSLAHKTPYKIEHRLKFPDGRIKYVLEQCETFYDHEGKPLKSIGTVQDITESKKAEEQLAQSEIKFRSLYENNLAGIYQTSFTGEIIACNNTFAKIFGFDSPAELVGKNVSQFYFTSSDRQEFLNKLISENRVFNHEEKLKHKDGSVIYVLENSYMQPEDGGGKKIIDGVLIDITERKKAVDKLKESENKYRILMQKAGDLIVLFDKEGRFLEVNESSFHVLGFTLPGFQNKSLVDFVFPEDLKKQPFRFDELDKGMSTITRRRLRRADGTAVEVEIHAKKLSENVYLGVARDMTERLKTERILHEKDLQLREISAAIPGFIYQFIMDSSGVFRFSFVSDSVKEMVELTPEEIYQDVGRTFSKVHPEDLPGLYASIYRSADTLKPWQYIFRIQINDTEVRWLRGSSIPKKNEDGTIVWNGAMFEITEIKKAEEKIRKNERKFKDLLESTPDAIVIVNQSGSIIMNNHQAETLFNYEKSGMIGAPIEKLMPESIRPDHIKHRETYIQNPTARSMGKSIELTAVKKDGLIFPVEVSLSPLLTEDGMLITAAIRDITERKMAEEKLEESYRSVRELTEHLQNIREEERTAIAREIHDELGQQLTAMMMDMAWLNKRAGRDNTMVKEKIDEVLLMMDKMVKTVRRISRELRPSVLDDLGILAAMEIHLAEFEKRSGIRTHFTPPPIEPLLDVQVKNGLFRIFQESLTNVARHSRASNIYLKFEIIENNINLIIEDDGEGFDEKIIMTKKTLGVLGMKERAAMMGGKYAISGKPGKGTVVEVNIPSGQKK